MKKFEVLQELPNCDAETWSEQILLGKNGANRLAPCRVATKFQFVKSAISVKGNKAKQ